MYVLVPISRLLTYAISIMTIVCQIAAADSTTPQTLVTPKGTWYPVAPVAPISPPKTSIPSSGSVTNLSITSYGAKIGTGINVGGVDYVPISLLRQLNVVVIPDQHADSIDLRLTSPIKQVAKSESEALAGYRAVVLTVVGADTSDADTEVLNGIVRNVVRDKLHEAGLSVYDTYADIPGGTFVPLFVVNIPIIKIPDPDPVVMQYAYSGSISLRSPVATGQRLKVAMIASVWDLDLGIAYAGKNVVADGISKFVGDGMDAFISDYLKANPPQIK